ncbi:MAG: GFA family protein [Pseudomonadales bacterium]|nr:GFA family protein [Pseudomonadales bacterium]
MKVDGCCHCGAVTYDAEISPDQVVICHCTDCQTFSSAPYRVSVFGVTPDNVRIAGAPKTYVKTGGSGKKVTVAFCGDCGTALYSTKGATNSPLNLRVGAIKQRAQLIPKMQGFCGSAMTWAMNIDGIHRVPEPDKS